MKLIFLDVDGVLNSRQFILDFAANSQEDSSFRMDPLAVARLNQITDATGAKIVVSSSMRLEFMGQLTQLQAHLHANQITGECIGMTGEKPNAVRDQRGKEIQAWLDDHHNQVDKFVIIDDDTDMGRLRKNLILTNFEDGLQDRHVKQIIDTLGTK